MRYDFDWLPDRRSTESVKWNHYDPDILPLWVADMDFASPEPVIRALRERVEHGVFGYAPTIFNDPHETLTLRRLIQERLMRKYRWEVQPDEMIFLPGVIPGFNLACHAMASASGNVLVQTPVYPPILAAPGNAGMECRAMELVSNPDGEYGIDREAFERAVTDRTRLFILCSPHNPVGRVFRRDELEMMADVCLRQGVVICSDEIHSDIVFSGHRHIPIATLGPEIAANTITLISPSKTFNLAGFSLAVAIIQNPDLRQKVLASGKGLVSRACVMGLTGAQAAFQDGEDWLDQLLCYLESNRDFLVDYVRHEMPGIRVREPEGSYLAWLDCRKAGIDGDPFMFFLEKARVALNAGASFGKGGEGFVRLNYGCPRSVLAEALQRMRNACLQTRRSGSGEKTCA